LKSNCSQTICGCLRNAVSIAGFLNEGNYRIGIIAAGEKWNDGSIRYCIEDYIGAGSIISNINGKKSPEASLAEITYKNLTDSVYNIIKCSCSGLELEDRGFINDVELACRENTSSAVPLLFENKYYKNIK
jgi:2-phosphosulfolactate phosphatase